MNYIIMHKSDIIALADENGINEIINKSLCPACFAIGMPLEIWLDNRSVDIHRSHSRKLFKALRLRTPDDIEQVIDIGHGISITDNWWIQKADEELDYSSLKQYNEEIADIALYGSSASNSGNTKGYRELGTVGSYEKAWRYINGSWYMFKHGNTQELISEYYSYQFLKAMGADVAEYEIQHSTSEETGITSTFIITKDFTSNADVDFEPFCSYYTDHDEPEYILPRLEEKLIKPYVMMVFYDALLHNDDRHNQNAGVLRNSSTGEIIGLAPYFDYNLGLISTGVPRIDDNKGNVFTESFLANEVCCNVLKDELPDRDTIKNSISTAERETDKAFPDISPNYDLIKNYIVRTYDFLDAKLHEHQRSSD
ncbi:MAG: hypothetical protein IKH75_11320 [Ruminococcus sp.]|nr:hypothetical protein [Ruminococcus sp.]